MFINIALSQYSVLLIYRDIFERIIAGDYVLKKENDVKVS